MENIEEGIVLSQKVKETLVKGTNSNIHYKVKTEYFCYPGDLVMVYVDDYGKLKIKDRNA